MHDTSSTYDTILHKDIPPVAMKMTTVVTAAACLVVSGVGVGVSAFVAPQSYSPLHHQHVQARHDTPPSSSSSSTTPTTLNAIIDVPLGFFTVTGLSLGIFNAIMRPVNRQVLEERAWQSRLDEARAERMAQDPTLTELDMIREEAEAIAGPYGPDAMERRERDAEEREMRKERRGRRSRVMVMDEDDDEDDYYDDDDDDFEYESRRRSRRRNDKSSSRKTSPSGERKEYVPMTDEKIDDFEAEYGVEYDPYYDEPYEEDELPTDSKCYTDGMFLDKRYENGEVFYYDEDIDMYWRQGCKPRIKKMFGF